MEITNSSEIKKLLDSVLMLSNRLEQIKTYYNTITSNLETKLSGVKTNIQEDIDWMDTQLTKINLLYNELLTQINEFVTKSDGELIESHVEYQYMTNLFTTYMNEFYNRMTETEILLEEEFLQTGLSITDSLWSFQYSRVSESNVPINIYFESINWTPETRFIEISNNHFILTNKDGYFFDINYNTKVVKPFSFRSVFKNYKKDALYTIHDIAYDEYTDTIKILASEQTPSSNTTETLYLASFDIATEKESLPLITASTLQDIGQQYFFINFDSSNIFYRTKNLIYGYNRSTFTIKSVFTPNQIVGAAIFSDYLVYNTNSGSLAIIQKSDFNTIRNYSMTTAPLLIGDNGTIIGIHSSKTKIYIVTGKSIYSSDDAFVTVIREERVDNIGVPLLTFNDTTKYAIDQSDHIYYLYDKTFIYSVNLDGAVVMSPSKSSDKIIAIDANIYSNTAGYAINDNTDLVSTLGTNFDHVVYYKNIAIAASFIGKSIVSVDLKSGYWTKDDGNPLLSDKIGPIIFADNSTITSRITSMIVNFNTLYVGTENGILYTCDLLTNTWNILSNATAIGVAAINSILVKSPYIIVSGQYGRVASYHMTDMVWTPYDNDSKLCNAGTAMGGSTIYSSTNTTDQLIFGGAAGRICSVNMSNFKWTRYNGEVDNIIDTEITSLVFNDGTTMGFASIESLIVYNSTILLIAGHSGRVASGFTNSNYYTSYDGTDTIIGKSGPGYYNNATAIGVESIRSALIVGDTYIIGGNLGRIASLNLDTYGWTNYAGLDINESLIGPKVYYDGISINYKNILALTHDPIRENIYFVGQTLTVGSISLVTKEAYTKYISKLYYIGKKTGVINRFDSNLVEINKTNFTEKKFLRPAREFSHDPYIEMYNGNNWVYMNNGFVYRVETNLTKVYRSLDSGTTYKEFTIVGSTPLLPEDNINYIEGYVSTNGVLVIHVVVNNNHSLIIGDVVEESFMCKRITIASTNSISIQQIADTPTSFTIFKRNATEFSLLEYDLVAATVNEKVIGSGLAEVIYNEDILFGITSDRKSIYLNKLFDKDTNYTLNLIPENKINIYVDKWMDGVSFTTARRSHTAVVLDGKIYLMGGYDGTTELNDMQIYDPETDEWTTGSSFEISRNGHTSVVLNGKIYLMGGRGSNSTYLNDMQIYDPETDEWTSGVSFDTGRRYHTSVVLDSKIYLMGGYDGTNYLNDMQIYDPNTNSWIIGASFNIKRFAHTSVVLDGKIYLMGGHNGTTFLNDVKIYDPNTNKWTTGVSFDTGRRYHTSVVLDGKIYLMGGHNGTTRLNDMQIYDLETNEWTTSMTFNIGRDDHTTIILNDKIYLMGGWDGTTHLNDVQIYDPNYAFENLSNVKILSAMRIKPTEEKLFVGIIRINEDYDIITETYEENDSSNIIKISKQTIEIEEYIKDIFTTNLGVIQIDKVYEYIFNHYKQMIVGLNITIPYTVPIKKHITLSIEFDTLTNDQYISSIGLDTLGHTDLITIDFEYKRIIAAIRRNENPDYYDEILRFEMIPKKSQLHTQSIKDIWLNQPIDSSYMTGASAVNAAAIISNNNRKADDKFVSSDMVSRQLHASSQDIVLYHPDYGMIMYNSIKKQQTFNSDPDTNLPLFESSIKVIDGFEGHIADVISPITQRGVTVASGVSNLTEKTSQFADITIFRNAKVGTVVSDSTKKAIVMVRPLSTTFDKQEKEYFLAKLNFENGALSSTVDNVSSEFESLESINGMSILPINISATSYATGLLTNTEFETFDPKQIIEENKKLIVTPGSAHSLVYTDKYVKHIIGTGIGVMTVDGVYQRNRVNIRKFVPYSKNNIPISIHLDTKASHLTINKNNIKSLLSGYSMFSSFMDIVAQQSVLGNADIFIDLKFDKVYLRVGSVIGIREQEFYKPIFGNILFTQKSITDYNRTIKNAPFVVTVKGIDNLLNRNLGYAYDRIYRFSLNLEPYKNMPLFWAPRATISYMINNDSLIKMKDISESALTNVLGVTGYTVNT